MDTETLFRVLFWILFGGVMVMRVYFSIQVRRPASGCCQTGRPSSARAGLRLLSAWSRSLCCLRFWCSMR